MTIYTRGGDGGETGLADGRRVMKSDRRVAAYGDIDELNAALGVVLAGSLAEDLAAMLREIQGDLLVVGGRLASPGRPSPGDARSDAAVDVRRLEKWIDALDAELPPLRRFVLPGGSAGGAALHLARTICRRAERHIVALGAGEVDPALLAWVNRLSDLLFVAARVVNRRAGAPEHEW